MGDSREKTLGQKIEVAWRREALPLILLEKLAHSEPPSLFNHRFLIGKREPHETTSRRPPNKRGRT